MSCVAPFIPVCLALCAFCFGTAGNVNCRTVEFPPLDGEGPTIDAGLFAYQIRDYFTNDEDTWYHNVCQSYTDIEDDFGYDYEVDRKMQAIQNIAITILFLGGIALCGSCIAPVLDLGPTMWKLFGISFLSMSILQGVTLLVLESSVCLDNPILQFLGAELPLVRARYGEECEWGLGFKLGITAVFFWFVAGVFVFVVPTPARCDESPSAEAEEPAQDQAQQDQAKVIDYKLAEDAEEVEEQAKVDDKVKEDAEEE